MRLVVFFVLAMLAYGAPVRAQGNSPDAVTPEQRRSVGDEKAAETRALLEKGKKRQQNFEQRSTNVMARWSYAVCIGCGATPKGFRLVHTHPLRVLAGIQAASDDAAAQSGRLRIWQVSVSGS